MQSRSATPADADAITTTIALAFRDDPVWGPALEAADGGTAYLESTNPANDHRYERAGFRPVGGFRAVIDGAAVTTMWHDVAPVDSADRG